MSTAEGWAARRTTVAAIAFSVLATILVGWRLRFGVDFIDEAFYVAIPFRFAHGARPFVDEMAVQQTAQMLLVPFVKAFLLVRGDGTGIVLAVRALWLLMMSACAFVSYDVLKRIAPRAVAILSSATLLVFIPFLIPSVSYNTLGAAFLALGLYFGVLAFVFNKGVPRAVASGVFLGLAAMAYPTFLVAGPVFVLALYAVRGRRAVHEAGMLRPLIGGYIATGIALAVLLLSFGFGNLMAAFRFSSTAPVGGGLSKLVRVSGQVGGLLGAAWPAFLLLAIALALGRKWPWANLLVLGMPLFILRATTYGYLANVGPILLVVAACIVLFFGPPRDPEANSAAWLIILPAVVCGALTAYTSTNGYNNAFVGMLAAVPLSVAVLASLPAAASRGPRLGPWAAACFCALVVGVGVWAVYQGCYSDPRPTDLHSAIKSGPYAGMVTTAHKAESWTSLQQTVQRLGLTHRDVVFFDAFPAGYLLVPSPRAINSVWSGSTMGPGPVIPDTAGVGYLNRTGASPNAGIRILGFDAKDRTYAADHPLSRYFSSPPYAETFSGPSFQVFSRP